MSKRYWLVWVWSKLENQPFSVEGAGAGAKFIPSLVCVEAGGGGGDVSDL